jgi:hypothetical protein
MRFIRAVTALVVVIAAALALAAPAEAAGRRLAISGFRIDERTDGSCTTVVDGVIPYDSQASAQFVIDNGGAVTITLYGDDPTYDDYIGGGYRVPQLYATPAGEISFHIAITALNCSRYDEDDSFYDDADEIYATVRFYSYRTLLESKNSKIWHWYF